MYNSCQESPEMAIVATGTQNSKYSLTWLDFQSLCHELCEKIDWTKYDSIFPVIRGGVYPAIELSMLADVHIVWEPSTTSLVVDDICDSGQTIKRFLDQGLDVATLFHKGRCDAPTYYAVETQKWIVFPWESPKDIEDSVRRQIEYIGENPNRCGIEETPRRVVKSWTELYAGYQQNPKEILSKRFQVERKNAELSPVILREIEFQSTCEHHLLPFLGTVTIGYLPKNEVVGISKLARLVECFSRRLQIQERMCEQIADAIQTELDPLGVFVKARAKHLCMVARGVREKHAEMESIAVRGNYDVIERTILNG